MSQDISNASQSQDEIFFDPGFKFGFEKNFDEPEFRLWIQENWTLSMWYSAVYVICIFYGKHYMNKRERFEIRIGLFMWSFILAVFSIFGAVRTIPELWHIISEKGFQHSICDPSYFKGPTAFWAFMFTISKVYELGDTLFIVLRKQQLIFLHWYHHITVLMYVWYSYSDHTAPGRWFMVMNYTVHSLMYTYYALRAMRVRMPRFISIMVTSLQLSQMVWGVSVCILTYFIKTSGQTCQQSYDNLTYGFAMYVSYFVLFGHFFYNAYINNKSVKFQKMANVKTPIPVHQHQD